MKNRYTGIFIFSLLVAAGVGLALALYSYLRPEAGLQKGSALTVPGNDVVKENLRAQRALFQPLDLPSRQNIDSGIQGRSDAPALLATEVARPNDVDASVAPPAAPTARKLLQGNQNMQRATQFKKIDFIGETLSNSATRWSCARDAKTGLLWETKLFDAGVSDVEHRYSWYDPTREAQGHKNRGSCYAIDCDTYAYAKEMNRLKLCGSGKWRLPTFAELETLLDRDYFNPVINQAIFYNTRGASYWTQSQLENNQEMVMQIDFFNGTSSPAPIHFKLAVRMVSD